MKHKILRFREAAFRQQAGRCYYCALPMFHSDVDNNIDRTARRSLVYRLTCTAEHLVAASEGGRDSAKNIVAACRHCNHTRHRAKRPLPHNAYKEHVRRRMRAGRWHPIEVRVATRFVAPTEPPAQARISIA